VERRDGVIQRRECLGLALEADRPLAIGDERVEHDLDGDVAPELCVTVRWTSLISPADGDEDLGGLRCEPGEAPTLMRL
jgi:hypothetical protein